MADAPMNPTRIARPGVTTRLWGLLRVAVLSVGCLVWASAHGQVLRYGGDEAFAPFESTGADGQPQGFQIDLMNALTTS